MKDVLPEDMPVWNRVEGTARSLAARRGLREIRPTLLEETDLFCRSVGEVTPSYLYYNQVAERMRDELGEARIVVALRDPIEKAFSQYMHLFSDLAGAEVQRGSLMAACHWPEEKVSIVNFGVGSPVAALVIDLLAFVDPVAILMLGLCGGLVIHRK